MFYAVVGASPFQAWEACPFPAIPYRPHPMDLTRPYIAAQARPVGDEARRCYMSTFQRTVKSVTHSRLCVKIHPQE